MKTLILTITALFFTQVPAQIDITAPGDFVQGVPNDSDWPGGEAPPLAIDDNIQTKYLHFKGETQSTGFQVTPAMGASVVTGLTFTTANDAVERDPVAFELSGSNTSINGPYTLIARQVIVDFAQAAAWPRFTKNTTPIVFQNNTAYAHYQLLFTSVRNAGGANSVQIAEVEFLATPKGGMPPVVDAGADREIAWKGDTPTWLQMHSSIYDDDPCNVAAQDPNYLIVLWSSAGSLDVDFMGTDSEPNAMVVFPVPGVYTLKLQVWDDRGLEGSDTVVIRVAEPDCPWTEAPGDNPLMITEIMASNDTTYATQVNHHTVFSDWIEIFNASTHTLNLSGWSLTDDPNDLTKWPLPGILLGAETYYVVHASGILAEDHPENFPYQDDLGRYHTNFELNQNGEYLALVNPEGEVVSGDIMGYPPQVTDVSYGLCGNQIRFFTEATPGLPNRGGGSRVSDRPQFSRPGTAFVTPFSLSLTALSATADIRYTLDGSVPTDASTLYTDPIDIRDTTEVLCRTFEPGLVPSDVASATYIALNQDVQDFSSNLPIVIVETQGQQVIYGSYRKVTSSFIDRDDSGRSHITGPADYIGATGIKTRGRSTAGSPKRNYGLELWDSGSHDLGVSILGMPAESDWILYAPYSFDRALINNAFMFELSRQIGRYAVRTRFVEVFVNTGRDRVSEKDYVGLYILMEKIKRDADRVDVESLEPWDTTEPRISGGYMLKIDRPDSGDSGFRTARGNPTYGDGTFCYVSPKEDDITQAQSAWIRAYLNDFEDALYGPVFKDPLLGYASFIDVASFVDHNLLNMLAMNVDALRLSTHLYKPRDGRLHMGPIWDFDRSLNSADGRDDNPATWHGSGDGTDYLGYVWWNRLFEDPEFWQRYIDRWTELRQTTFSDERINGLIDDMVAEIKEAQVRNQARWPGAGPRYGGYAQEIGALKDWLARRTAWVDAQFVSPPVFLPSQGYVPAGQTFSMSDPGGAGVIYYTLDGSDPHVMADANAVDSTQVPGSISSRAIQYTGQSITFDQMTLVRARILSLGKYSPWSGMAEAYFTAGPISANLRVTEIMYHAPEADPSSGELPVDAEDFEYIVLMNVGDTILDLSGVSIASGVSFGFRDSLVQSLAPEASVLVVKDQAAFESRYGTGLTHLIAGQYQGKLSNSGEMLRVYDSTEGMVAAFQYEDGWYAETDGQGDALILRFPEVLNPNAWNTKAAWQPGSSLMWTPVESGAVQ
ncbi:MAG: CotH kinase family protein [Phycisphaerae bacterium]|nr:CotH kinase family protein [Phycisphaerae bacterium]